MKTSTTSLAVWGRARGQTAETTAPQAKMALSENGEHSPNDYSDGAYENGTLEFGGFPSIFRQIQIWWKMLEASTASLCRTETETTVED